MSTAADSKLSLLLVEDSDSLDNSITCSGQKDAGWIRARPDVPEVGPFRIVIGRRWQYDGIWVGSEQPVACIAHAGSDI
jgi:hypothetical protein